MYVIPAIKNKYKRDGEESNGRSMVSILKKTTKLQYAYINEANANLRTYLRGWQY